MAPPIKWVGKEASILALYRNLLKSCARHPDPYVGEWYACRWRGQFKDWFDLSPRPEPDEIAVMMHDARQIILRLQRASSGDKIAFNYTVDQAYGGSGPGRWPLLKPFTRSRVLPPKISILRDRPHRTLPSYSPFLVTVADSPLMLDTPRPPLRLALPETLPPHGFPANPELLNRQFISPARETNIRKQYYNALLNRIKVPLCVRVVGVEKPKVEGEEGKNVWDSLKELGIDWREFSDGRREVLLDRLEQFAGKGARSDVDVDEKTRTRRTPVNEIDPSLPPFLPTPLPSLPSKSSSSSSTSEPRIPLPPPSFPIPRPIHLSSLAPARFPEGYQQVYRDLLSNFPLLTVDLSRIEPPGEWLAIQFSPYSTNGPAFFHPIDPIEDLPFLQPPNSEDGLDSSSSSLVNVDADGSEASSPTQEEDDDASSSLFTFPPFVHYPPLRPENFSSLSEENKSAFLQEKIVRREAALTAEVERRRGIVRAKLEKRGLSEEEIEWEMEGKWEEAERSPEGEAVETTRPRAGDDGVIEKWEREMERSRERKVRRAREREREGRMVGSE
ncbi:hypothetical protein BDY24DRAFT_402729 [Mrakia frigida]|uniref:uncharacterized protein n=1 Tax=Mrakia frigida TaxID=29902 RepID=UPI003FCC030E